MAFYESSLFIDILLITIYVMLAAAIGLVVWSVVCSLRKRDVQSAEPGFPAKLIAWGTGALLVLTLCATYLFADTTPIIINGQRYSNALWLCLSDVLINTSVVLIIVAVICVVFGALWAGRRKNV